MKSNIKNANNPWISPIPKNWGYGNLEELCSNIIDNRGKTVPTSEHGIPLIATNCISNDTIFPIYEKIRYVSEETYANWFRGHPEPGDIIFVNKGTPGQVCLVPDPVDFCIAQDMVAIRPNEKLVDGKYLFAILRTPFFQKQIQAFHVGTLIPHLKKTDFKELTVPLAPRKLQNFIGKCYYDISRKISFLEKINFNLDETAKTIFRSFFIDYDDEKEFVKSGLSKIPKGWEIDKLGKHTYIKARIGWRGLSISEYVPEGPYIITGPQISKEGRIDWESCARVTKERYEESPEIMIQNGDILLTKDGTIGKLAYINDLESQATLSGHIFVIRCKSKFINQIFLLYYLKSEGFEQLVESRIEGSVIPALYQRDIVNIELVIPPAEKAERFASLVSPLLKQIGLHNQEIHRLSHISNSILRKLMLGEIVV